MKKIFFVFLLLFSLSLGNVQAQSWRNLLGKVAGEVAENVTSNDDGGVLGNVLGSLLGQSMTLTEEVLEGTWEYRGVACVLESESMLSEIGGSLVTSQVEERLDGLFARVGVAPGTCTFTFVGKDSCVFNVAGRNVAGGYTLNAEEKVIEFRFLYDRVSFRTFVSYNVTDMNIVFDADRLLSLVKSVTGGISSGASSLGSMASGSEATAGLGTSASAISSTLNTVGSLLDNYNGMMLGMKLKKK